jgi:hypothetical protein
LSKHEGEPNELEPSHWAHYTTDALRQLLLSLEAAAGTDVPMTLASVRAELERRASSRPD